MRRLYVGFAAAIAALATATPAFAQANCVQFDVLGNGANGEYNPFNRSNASEAFQVRASRVAEGVTGVRFILVDSTPRNGSPGFGSSGPLNYDIEWLGGDTSRTVFTAANEPLNATNGATIVFPGRQGVDVSRFRLSVPRGQAAAAGRHIENLTVRYSCLYGSNTGPSSSTEQQASLRLELSVPSYVAAYVGGVGQSRGTIDFGTVSANTGNLSRSIGVTALSTVPYEVTVASERGGRLRLQPKDAEGIPYTMKFSGEDVEAGSRIVCPATPAPIGKVDPLEVTLRRNSLSKLRAGDYSDTVTLTFQPRDGSGAGACRVAAR